MLLTGRKSGVPPLAGLPQTNPYLYALNYPVGVVDPTGQFGVVGVVAIGVTAIAAGVVIYSIYKCAQACDADRVCPYGERSIPGATPRGETDRKLSGVAGTSAQNRRVAAH